MCNNKERLLLSGLFETFIINYHFVRELPNFVSNYSPIKAATVVLHFSIRQSDMATSLELIASNRVIYKPICNLDVRQSYIFPSNSSHIQSNTNTHHICSK